MLEFFIATAETQEAYDIAHGTVHVYGPDDTHSDANVWDEAGGEMPHGVWISPCGHWRAICYDDDHVTGRNFCYCPFCKSLRQKHGPV